MKSYTQALGILLQRPGVRAHHAAGHLVAAQVVKSDPIAEPAACDAELREMLAETGLEVLLRAPMTHYS